MSDNDIDGEDVLIEEINSNDVPVGELSQFQETQPLTVVEIIDGENYGGQSGSGNTSDKLSGGDGSYVVHNAVEEGALINRYIQGVGEFPELYTKLEPGEEEEEEEDDEAAASGGKARSRSGLVESMSITDSDVNDSDDDDKLSVAQRAGGGFGASTSQQANKSRLAATPVARPRHLQPQQQQQRSKTSGMGRRSMLSPALLGLMGEANLSLAHGKIETAERICLEIIRQNPLASEPFYTLAGIYETRDAEKFVNILTIAAHLNPHDRDTWIRIADIYIGQGNFQMARVFYSKAIKALYKDYDLRLRKAQLLERMGETNAAMFTYLKMLQLVPLHEAELCLNTAKNVARHFHGLQKYTLALEAMTTAYAVCGARFALDDLNLYLELLILNKQYAKALSCLRERTRLELETEDNDKEMIFFCVIPDDFVADVRTKLCVCLIHLRAHHLLGYLVQNVHKHIPVTAESIEQYMDITEALMQEHKYAEAISLMRPITDGDTVDCPAFVWLRQAECLRQLNRTNEAIDAYARVVELAPFCYEAKFTLSALLKQQGRHVDAVKALEQSGECEGQPLHARLLYERCIMLQEIGRIDEFLEVGYVLLGRHSIKLKNRQEMFTAANGGGFYNADGIRAILQRRHLTEGDSEQAMQELQKPQSETSDLTTQDEYTLFLELIRTAFKHRKFSVIERICFVMVTTKRFSTYHTALERIIILACYFNDDCNIGFSYLRELISKNSANVNLWNLHSLFVQKGDDLRYFRYIRRLVARQPLAHPMRLFLGHYHLNCSSYKYALDMYVPIFREKRDPILALCIASAFNQLAMQKKVLRKAAAVAQAVVFVQKYAELRAGAEREESLAQQEIYYNIGRVYHQAGVLHLAVEYYERALSVQNPLLVEHESYMGLQHEAAFNLHLIYRASGNTLKARNYLMRYCVV